MLITAFNVQPNELARFAATDSNRKTQTETHTRTNSHTDSRTINIRMVARHVRLGTACNREGKLAGTQLKSLIFQSLNSTGRWPILRAPQELIKIYKCIYVSMYLVDTFARTTTAKCSQHSQLIIESKAAWNMLTMAPGNKSRHNMLVAPPPYF